MFLKPTKSKWASGRTQSQKRMNGTGFQWKMLLGLGSWRGPFGKRGSATKLWRKGRATGGAFISPSWSSSNPFGWSDAARNYAQYAVGRNICGPRTRGSSPIDQREDAQYIDGWTVGNSVQGGRSIGRKIKDDLSQMQRTAKVHFAG